MKVIDLLNKIANGEEVPKKIKYEDMIFEYEDGDYYIDVEEQNGNIGTYVMLEHLRFNKDYDNKEVLQLEVEELKEEVIEEDKKIEKLSFGDISGTPKRANENDIIDKINEIIDYINGGTNE